MIFKKTQTSYSGTVQPRGLCTGTGDGGCYVNKVFNETRRSKVFSAIQNHINNASCVTG